MATVAIPLPKTRRRPRNVPTAGRANFPEFYFVKHIDNSRLRREVDVERRRELIGLLGMGCLVFLFGFVLAVQHFRCVRYGYEINQCKTERKTLEEQNYQLRLEQARLAAPERIDALARTHLGMVTPAPQQVKQVLRPNLPTDVPGPAELARNFSLGNGDSRHEP